MSYCKVTLQWPGGEHDFALTWRQLSALEGLTDMGPLALLRVIQSNTWRLNHLLSVLRLGLIGGGMDPGEAKKLVLRASEDAAPAGFVAPAVLVLSAGVVGVTQEDAPEEEGDG